MEEVKGATCALILSDKSSGSSILQTEMLKHPSVRALAKTPHQEGETLFWNKAAALLGRGQEQIAHSHVLPMEPSRARQALESLCTDNAPGFEVPSDDRALVFEGWRALAHAHRPVFLEKSPHHLHYRTALALILEAEDRQSELAFRFIGLVRDPMDTIYSMWNRWRVPPEKSQHDWVRAYQNLLWLKAQVGERTLLVRYEDLVSDPACLQRICALVGIETLAGMGSGFSPASVGAWRKDKGFGFQPAPEVNALAGTLGYPPPELARGRFWPLRRELGIAARRMRGGRFSRKGRPSAAKP
ncbi:MAG: sulfotransferase family protein [Acidimicrobiia bacterium]